MTPSQFLRDVALVARFEMAEAVRSRLLVVVVLLFVGAGALGAWSFGRMVEAVETNAAKVTGAPTARRPGGMVRTLRRSRSYRDILRVFLGNEEKANHFAAMPPMVVFFGFASFMFTPWLVLFTSSETIASEVASRGIRFSVLRTGRLPFALGKMSGQALVLAGVTALQAVAFFVVAWATLDGFEAGATAAGLLGYWPRVLLYSLPFLAWAMLASMAMASTNLARMLSLGGGTALAILSGMAANPLWRTGPVSTTLWDLASFLTPYGHSQGLFYPPGGRLGSDVAICLALTVVYFAAGFAVLRRRDL